LRCGSDETLSDADAFPPTEDVVQILAGGLDRPQPVDAGPDEVVPRVATLFADVDSLVTVLARQLLHLRDAIADTFPALPGDERVEAQDRLDTITTWLVAHISVTRIRAISLEALRYPLTGLWSKVRFRQDLTAEVARIGQGGGPVHVVALDLDGFKRINDTLGHEGGDSVLRTFAASLSENAASTGTAYHLSGDEFALIVRTEDPERIISEAAASASVSSSYGVLTLAPAHAGWSPEAVHDEADQRLRLAKEAKKGWWRRLRLTLCGGAR
jgi:diguanylate cyclase (GGDEF)-like protein